MYAVQREPARNFRINHPAASPVRKHAPAQAAVPGYCQEPSASARSQSLGYTMESAGALSRMPMQRVPDDDKSNFFDNLSTIIRNHIDTARPDSRIRHENNSNKLWNDITINMKKRKNVSILISKILSTNTPGVENRKSLSSVYSDDNYKNFTEQKQGKTLTNTVNSVFVGLGTPISETLNDILYWTSNDNATSVSTIQLTDSDLHHRGVGVCIVEYQKNSDQKKIVVKPEDKTFDKTIYDKNTASLAKDFNASLVAGSLGKNFKKSRIGTLDIQTSNKNRFGSSMEFFDHNRLNTMVQAMRKNIDLHSVESLIAFSSLLGLADLHVENAVYSPAPKPAMQLIDAEIGMKYLLHPREDGALLQTALYAGEMMGDSPSVEKSSLKRKDFENYNPDSLSAFMDKAKDKLTGKKSRIVLLPTATLFTYRSWYLQYPENWHTASDEYYTELRNAVTNYYKQPLVPTFHKASRCKAAAKEDFAAGRIPFFELHYSTGKVWQKLPSKEILIATYAAPGNGSFLDFMIQRRKDALTQEFLEIQEQNKAQRNKKILTGIGLTGLAAVVAGIYYLLGKN